VVYTGIRYIISNDDKHDTTGDRDNWLFGRHEQRSCPHVQTAATDHRTLVPSVQLLHKLRARLMRWGRLYRPVQVAEDGPPGGHRSKPIHTGQHGLKAHVHSRLVGTHRVERVRTWRHLTADARATARLFTDGARQTTAPCRNSMSARTQTYHCTYKYGKMNFPEFFR